MPGDVEIELKFRAETDAPLLALARADRLGAARLGPPDTFAELDRYLDTPDRRLETEGWACRLRLRRGEWLVSLKGRPLFEPVAEGALHRRPELEGPANDLLDPASWPASRARELLLAIAAGRPLNERLRLGQGRTERSVGVDGRGVGTLSLDEVRVVHEGRELGTLHAVELEMSASDDALAVQLASALAALPGLSPDRMTKLEHALSLLAAEGGEAATAADAAERGA